MMSILRGFALRLCATHLWMVHALGSVLLSSRAELLFAAISSKLW
jgi:hypothetical protein